MAAPRVGRALARFWPWLLIALAVVPAVWHVVDFEEDADVEFPRVARPTFNRLPPSAYRLADPGDTIDHAALYVVAGVIGIAATGWAAARAAGRPSGLWVAAAAVATAAWWSASTPGPCLDGWHGIGWPAMFDSASPVVLRCGLALAAAILAGVIVASARPYWPQRAELWRAARARGAAGLLAAAVVFVALRQFELPGVEPAGYWPRWCFVWGMIAFAAALVRLSPPWPRGWRLRAAFAGGIAAAWWALVVGGLDLMWFHRPLERFKVAVPGKIYISAMPTYRGLELAYARHHFKTIVNLFPEDTDERSPRLPQELRFVREHGITYLRSPTGALGSDAFLDRTLALARDPNAWPILVHCHGCQDRTPAWLGIYRFVVEGRPLDDVMREIECQRGYRPKASITLLYNRVLRPRAAERYDRDPTADLLRKCALGTPDPYYFQLEAERRAAHDGDRIGQRRAALVHGAAR